MVEQLRWINTSARLTITATVTVMLVDETDEPVQADKRMSLTVVNNSEPP